MISVTSCYRLLAILVLCVTAPLVIAAEKNSSSPSATPSHSDSRPIIAVYPSWEHSTERLQQIPWHNITHIALFAAYPSQDGNLITRDIDAIIEPLNKAVKTHQKKLILSIGGSGKASQGFIPLTANPDTRALFIKTVVDYVKTHQLDGIDIDWEFWTRQLVEGKGGNDPKESQQLLTLIKELRQALPNSVLLTTDIVAGNWYGPQYLVELQEHVDYVNLMAFDFTGAWSNSPIGYHSELPLFKLAIQHTLQRGFSAEKLLISLPAYGIEFKDGKTETAEHVLYKDIVEQLNRDPAALAKRQAGHLYFETASDIADKVKYIDSQGLAGITFFQLWGDHPDPEFSLLQHINAQWISPATTADSTEK